jgi:ABC-2 type transport system permease protein
MFLGLVEREVRARYRGSFLGFLWSLLNPLMLMGIYTLVFSVFMRIQVPNYALMLFTGLLPWTWFSTALVNGTASITANANLIKKVYFPLEILPLVAVSTNLVNFLLSLPVLGLVLALHREAPGPGILLLPILLVLQFGLTLGVNMILSTLNTFYRDVEQLLGPVLMAWFYVTPVVYPLSMLPDAYSWLPYVNPMAPIISAYQAIFLASPLPSALLLLSSGLEAAVVLAFGLKFFRSRKFLFAEVV